MCSNIDDDGSGLQFMTDVTNNLLTKWCRKCGDKTEAKVILRRKDAYCKQCFLLSVTHKFRACLGKSRLMRPGDKVLIGFSGSMNSIALLHLIKSGLQASTHKKLMFQPYLAFINEADAINLAENENNKLSEELKVILKQFPDFPVYQVPISLSTQSEDVLQSYLADERTSVENDASLRALFNALTSVTSRMDMLSKLRYNLLLKIAECLGCNKVFTAESADDLAIKLLANVSLGRGAQLPYDVGFSDDRIPQIKVIRPLRDLSKKELTFYCVFNNLTSIHVPSLSTKLDSHSSIQKLTEKFLSELQDGFPSTLSTVFRVADKLTTTCSNENICPLCKTQRESEEAICSSLKATQFSRLAASLGPTNFDEDFSTNKSSDLKLVVDKEPSENNFHGNISRSSQYQEQFQELLCYGCNLILKDADLNTFPPAFMKSLCNSNQMLKMKKEIEEFLL